jgi:hypothetical protein
MNASKELGMPFSVEVAICECGFEENVRNQKFYIF